MMSASDIEAIVADIEYPGYEFYLGTGATYLQVRFRARCVDKNELTLQHGRKWMLSRHMTRSEVVMTALKAVLTAVEHEAREAFEYRGRAIFAPHFDVDALYALAGTPLGTDVRQPA